MPDSPLSDPRISNKTPKAWAQQLQGRVQGHALWHAAPSAEGGGSVGDCGYIDGGRFVKLFNIFDAHNAVGIDPGFHRLTPTDIRCETKENVFPLSYSSRIRTIDLGMNLQTGPIQLPPAINATLSASILSEKESIAFLAFCGPSTTSAWFQKTRLLENYLMMEHGRILQHYRAEHPVEMNNLLIIQGARTAASWLGGLASGGQLGLRAESSIGGVGASVEMLSLEDNGWSVTHGNRYWDGPNISSEPCIVVRPIKMRAKERMISRLSSVVGMQGSKSQPHSPFGYGTQMTSGTSSENVFAQDFSHSSTGDDRSRSNVDSLLAFTGNDPSDEPLLDDQTDLLDDILDYVLASCPTVKVVVGSWNLIQEFIEHYGKFPENWQTMDLITAVVAAFGPNPATSSIAQVLRIDLRPIQPIVRFAQYIGTYRLPAAKSRHLTRRSVESAPEESNNPFEPFQTGHARPESSPAEDHHNDDDTEFCAGTSALPVGPGASQPNSPSIDAKKPGHRPAKNQSKACAACLDGHRKCDGVPPVCGPCRALGVGHQCAWPDPGSRRRQVRASDIEHANMGICELEDEIRQLREFCRRKGIDVDKAVPPSASARSDFSIKVSASSNRSSKMYVKDGSSPDDLWEYSLPTEGYTEV